MKSKTHKTRSWQKDGIKQIGKILLMKEYKILDMNWMLVGSLQEWPTKKRSVLHNTHF